MNKRNKKKQNYKERSTEAVKSLPIKLSRYAPNHVAVFDVSNFSFVFSFKKRNRNERKRRKKRKKERERKREKIKHRKAIPQ